jgi:dTDP-4-amino-4,6-dideoxygalactose transaminase
LSLPVYPTLAAADLQRVIDGVNEAVAELA